MLTFFYTQTNAKIAVIGKLVGKIGFKLTQECSPVEILSVNDFSTLKANAKFPVHGRKNTIYTYTNVLSGGNYFRK